MSNWENIRQRKQTRIDEINKRENKSRRAHACSLGDKTSVKARKNSKHEPEHDGPYEITQVNDNGTVRFQKGTVNDATNIRRIKPFHEQQKIKFATESNPPDHRAECSRPMLQQNGRADVRRSCLLNGGHTLCVESVSRHYSTPPTPCAATRAQSGSPAVIRHHRCRLAGLSVY
jgi:hypothetical protein